MVGFNGDPLQGKARQIRQHGLDEDEHGIGPVRQIREAERDRRRRDRPRNWGEGGRNAGGLGSGYVIFAPDPVVKRDAYLRFVRSGGGRGGRCCQQSGGARFPRRDVRRQAVVDLNGCARRGILHDRFAPGVSSDLVEADIDGRQITRGNDELGDCKGRRSLKVRMCSGSPARYRRGRRPWAMRRSCQSA